MEDESRRERGRRVRTEVLGQAHVTQSVEQADDFSLPIQELVMDYAWGEIWSRPGLDRRSRSVLNLGLLAAGGHHHELAVHVRGAVRNGLTVSEIREVLLQTAVYAGMPVGLEAFRVASAVLAQLRDEAAEAASQTAEAGPHVEEASGTTPRASGTSGTAARASEPSGTAPRASEPSGTAPRASEPSGTAPRASEPSGTAPRASEPTLSSPTASEPTAPEPTAPEPTDSQPAPGS